MRMNRDVGWVLACNLLTLLARLSNYTSMVPWAPGSTGALVQLGVVATAHDTMASESAASRCW
jgi:hypothetical protein